MAKEGVNPRVNQVRKSSGQEEEDGDFKRETQAEIGGLNPSLSREDQSHPPATRRDWRSKVQDKGSGGAEEAAGGIVDTLASSGIILSQNTICCGEGNNGRWKQKLHQK